MEYRCNSNSALNPWLSMLHASVQRSCPPERYLNAPPSPPGSTTMASSPQVRIALALLDAVTQRLSQQKDTRFAPSNIKCVPGGVGFVEGRMHSPCNPLGGWITSEVACM